MLCKKNLITSFEVQQSDQWQQVVRTLTRSLLPLQW